MKTNWRELNKQLPLLTEEQVLELLNSELDGLRRATFLERLHQRFNALRAARERKEILSAARAL